MMGLVVTPDFLPTARELRDLKPPYLRSIIYRLSDIDKLIATGIPILATINNQCEEVGFDWSGWAETMRVVSTKPLLGLCVGNEFDLFWQNNRADVPPEFAARLISQAAVFLRPRKIKIVATSVAGRVWFDYLAQLADLCRNDVDWFDLHAYGQRPDGWRRPGWGYGDLHSAILRARDICGKPVIMSEYGVKIEDAGTEEDVGTFLRAADSTIKLLGESVCPFGTWFAWSDQIGAPHEQGQQAFGLRRADGSKRPAWDVYRSLQGVEAVPSDMTPWFGKVGQGLLDMMQADGTRPAQRVSTWLPLGVTPSDIEECYGENGTKYCWLLTSGKGFRVKPS